jgi:murein L,D-transpeptidase YcbB/YkuD
MPNEFRDDEDLNRRAGVTLRKGVPVYLVYLTAFERDGKMASRRHLRSRRTAHSCARTQQPHPLTIVTAEPPVVIAPRSGA